MTDCATTPNCGALKTPSSLRIQVADKQQEIVFPRKDYPQSPYAHTDCGTEVPQACPFYAHNTKHTPIAYVDGDWVPHYGFPAHADWYAAACAGLGGFIDLSHQTSIPGSGRCDDRDECLPGVLIESGEIVIDLCECTVIEPGDGVEFVTDTGRGVMSPTHGVVVKGGGGTSLPILHHKSCPKPGCCVNRVVARFDFSTNNVC